MTAELLETSSDDWESRRLCPDETCIGLLARDGRCSVCGRQGSALEARVVEDGPPPPIAHHLAPATSPVAEGGAEISSDGDDFDDRVLCADESCIGVIGADGTCNVCHRRLLSAPTSV